MATLKPVGGEAFWNWRPETYDDPSLAKVCNIFGTVRRQMAWDHFENGGTPPPSFVYAERLEPHDRDMWTRLSQANWGGEFLPPMKPREIEIARVELLSTTGDVYSIRARTFRGKIRYRVVDENDGAFILPYDRSDEPLTVRELVRLLEESRFDGYDEPGLVRPFWDQQIECGDDPEDAVLFATVRSVLYEPRVTQVYEDLARAFVEECLDPHQTPPRA
jgi:hypothetical protein